MQLTEQQRAELERRGWKVADHQDRFWQYIELTRGQTALRLDKLGIDIPRNADEPSLRDVAEIAAVLDITPPGYRLVPEEVAEKALPLVQALAEQKRVVAEELIGAEERAEAFEEYRALMALASALQGKEVDTHG